MKACVNCRYFVRVPRRDGECARTLEESVDPVTGQVRARMDDCRMERLVNHWWMFGKAHCGPAGRYFEPKEAA